MINKFSIEIFKFCFFGFFTSIVIFYFQNKYALLGNQFLLDESIKIHHKKSYAYLSNFDNAQICPLYPKELNGVFDVDVYNIPSFNYLNKNIKNLNQGGFYKPESCIPREKLAVIIPYRDRATNLALLLKYLHPFLQKQSRYYRIFVVEQFGDDIFNKGRIMNIGVKEALKLDDFDCFIFHDVDLIPENDKNIYECYTQPRHLSPAVDELRYNLMYYNLVGGVLALNLIQLNQTNGYSNLYWGWGAEDDDMSMRILDSGFKITRPTNKIGRYKMILHGKRTRPMNRFQLLEFWKRYNIDGLSSLKNLNYSVKTIKYDYLYTNITVDIGPPVLEKIDQKQVSHSKFKFY